MSLNSGSLNWSFDCIDIKEGWNYDAGNYAAILELCCYFGIMLLLFFVITLQIGIMLLFFEK